MLSLLKFSLILVKLLLQGVYSRIHGLLKALALLARKQILTFQNQSDIGNLVFWRVAVVEFQRHLGIDDF